MTGTTTVGKKQKQRVLQPHKYGTMSPSKTTLQEGKRQRKKQRKKAAETLLPPARLS
jgi:hypothetical protein